MKPATGRRTLWSRKLQSGMTAVEITASLGIIAMGLIQATPMVQRLIIENQLSSASSALVADLNQARATAIKSGRNITICPSSDSISCTQDTWASGWIVFSDTNKNGTPDVGEVIHANNLDNSLKTQGYERSFMFLPDGTAGLPADVTIRFCFRKSEHQNLCSNVPVRVHGLTHSSSQASS